MITRTQLDAALPSVPAGVSCMAGDLTDADERALPLDFLVKLYKRASAPAPPQTPETQHSAWGPPTGPRAFSRHAPWIVLPAFTPQRQEAE
jgi:hypothetical protein